MTESTTHKLQVTRGDETFTASITEINGFANESVVVRPFDASGPDVEIYSAEFPVGNLGTANRTGYLATMLPSVIDARKRAARLGIPLAQALEAQIEA
jgi:hypothetical protein